MMFNFGLKTGSERMLDKRKGRPVRRWQPLSAVEHDQVDRLLIKRTSLTDWETKFLVQLAGRGQITSKQREVLDRLAARELAS